MVFSIYKAQDVFPCRSKSTLECVLAIAQPLLTVEGSGGHMVFFSVTGGDTAQTALQTGLLPRQPSTAGFCQAPGLPRSAFTGGTLTAACFMFLMKPHLSPFCNSQSDQDGPETDQRCALENTPQRPQAKASVAWPALELRQRPVSARGGTRQALQPPEVRFLQGRIQTKTAQRLDCITFSSQDPKPPTYHSHIQERLM